VVYKILSLTWKTWSTCLATLQFHGSKGATGTQASFLQLCNGDEDKVKYIDRRVAEKMGFERTLLVTGQTYPRKYDSRVLGILSGVAQSAHKFSNDIRLLQSVGEMEEPFGKVRSVRRPWHISATHAE